jgi:hypothetical protein
MRLSTYKTLQEALIGLQERGFVQEFEFQKDKVRCKKSGKLYLPNQLKLIEYHRFPEKGQSARTQIIFALKTGEGEKGHLILDYGVKEQVKWIDFFGKVKVETEEG